MYSNSWPSHLWLLSLNNRPENAKPATSMEPWEYPVTYPLPCRIVSVGVTINDKLPTLTYT